MNRLNVILLLAVFVLAMMYQKLNGMYLDEVSKSEKMEMTINNMGQTMTEFQMAMDDTLAVMGVYIDNLEYTNSNIEAKYQEMLQAANIKARDTKHVTEVGTRLAEKVEVPVYYDSFGGLKTEYNDSFAHISVGIDSTKLATIDYDIKDSLVVVNTQKQHRLLFGLIKWKENLKTMVYSTNPKMRITGVTAINKME